MKNDRGDALLEKVTDVVSFNLPPDAFDTVSRIASRMTVNAGVDIAVPGAFTIRNHSFKNEEPGAFVIRNHNFRTDKPGAYTIRNYRFEREGG
jgi:hypothetical protein